MFPKILQENKRINIIPEIFFIKHTFFPRLIKPENITPNLFY